jgi:hypothetical protein
LKASATIRVGCRDSDTVRGLVSVLTPDNEGAPEGLAISLASRGTSLEIGVKSGSPATALSTCLAFLRDIALFQEVWLLSSPNRRKTQNA